jgi:hypothetical protein
MASSQCHMVHQQQQQQQAAMAYQEATAVLAATAHHLQQQQQQLVGMVLLQDMVQLVGQCQQLAASQEEPGLALLLGHRSSRWVVAVSLRLVLLLGFIRQVRAVGIRLLVGTSRVAATSKAMGEATRDARGSSVSGVELDLIKWQAVC